MFRFTIRDVFWANLIVALLLRPAVHAAEWGDLTMRFAYDGDRPKPMPLDTIKDAAFCGAAKRLVDESLIIDQGDHGIANVLVWLLKDGADVPVHASYNNSTNSAAKIASKDCRFEPRIVVLQKAQKLIWSNEDPFGHGLRCELNENGSFDVVIRSGTSWERQFNQPEAQPAGLVCNTHPHMRAFLFVHDSPYAGISDTHGRVTIRGLPVGRRTFVVWHEKLGIGETWFAAGNSIQWSGGRMALDIKEHANELGEIKLRPEMLRR